MIEITGKPYGRWNLFRAALHHSIVVRLLLAPAEDDLEIGRDTPFCSQAVSLACRLGGVDPVPNLADRLTEPGDLARSSFFEYGCTLR